MEILDLQKRFAKVEKVLKSKPWFSKEKWLVSHHPFPEFSPDGVTFHVFKKHWFNEDKMGIHFESYLNLDPKKNKKAYITLHALHYDEFPSSKISRKKFSQPLVDLIYDEVSEWEGYKFRAGKYGLQPFAKHLNATDADFENQLIEELERLCKVIGPKIDKVLKLVIK